MNMKCLAILGAGGHGKVVADAALASGWNEIHFYDSSWPDCEKNSHWPILGNDQLLMSKLDQYDGVIVAIGDNQVRWQKYQMLFEQKAKIVNIIHPSAQVSMYAQLGIGAVVLANAVVNVDAYIGDACIINVGATIDHDSRIASAVHVCPGTNLSGAVFVGEKSWIGVGASVKQGIKIGQQVIIGAGAVVVADVPDGLVIVGNPARAMT
jgi:sugar O-acyltransferase (sialic acid O-acetyltransferase NeuD family)